MKNVAVALMLAAILAAQIALASRDQPLLLLAPAAVLLGVVAASALQGELTWLSAMTGALSPLALTLLGGVSTTVAITVLCALWLSPRLWLARSRSDLLRLTIVSLGAATLAALVVAHFVAAVPLYHFTSCVFGAGSLALATVVLPADTVLASSLTAAARLLQGEVHDAVLGAAEAHRQQARSGRRDAQESEWKALMKAVDRRLSVKDAQKRQDELDQKILEHCAKVCREEEAEDEEAPGPVAGRSPAPDCGVSLAE